MLTTMHLQMTAVGPAPAIADAQAHLPTTELSIFHCCVCFSQAMGLVLTLTAYACRAYFPIVYPMPTRTLACYRAWSAIIPKTRLTRVSIRLY